VEVTELGTFLDFNQEEGETPWLDEENGFTLPTTTLRFLNL
jgi:hypothetical protein